MAGIRSFFVGKGSITDMGEKYPRINRHGESSVKNVFIAGNLACVADIKAALNQAYGVAHTILSRRQSNRAVAQHPVVIIGAGPAGLNAASELKKAGIDVVVLERKKSLAAIRAFDKNLILYNAKTGDRDVLGDFPFEETTASYLLEDWEAVLAAKQLDIRDGLKVKDIRRESDGSFMVLTDSEDLAASQVIIATGKLITLNKIEIAEIIKKRPKDWEELVDARLGEEGTVKKETLASTEMPDTWLQTIGMRYENDWKSDRIFMLLVSTLFFFTFYILKNFYSDLKWLGDDVVNFGKNLSSWYPIFYSVIVVVFGIKAIFRYKDRLQTRKYIMLMFFQVMFYCVIPIYILKNWRAYVLAYPWPLVWRPDTHEGLISGGAGDHTVFYLVWVIVLSFVALPIWTMFFGKQYCSWVCGCGGLAETLGDGWRHYSPKGPANAKRERAGVWVLIFAAVTMVIMVSAVALKRQGQLSFVSLSYKVGIDLFLTSAIPLALYPFLGGKIWCRYWCPTMSLMQMLSKWYARKGVSHYAIYPKKDRCIACNFCTRYCEVGIDVRKYALKGEILDNATSSCVGCGICLSVCPTDTLSFNEKVSTTTLRIYEPAENILQRIHDKRAAEQVK